LRQTVVVELDPDDPPRIDAAYAAPFDRLLDPRAHAQALNSSVFRKTSETTQPPTRSASGVGTSTTGWS